MAKSLRPIILIAAGLILIAGGVFSVLFNPFNGPAQTTPAASTPAAQASGEEAYPEIKRISLGDAKAAFDLKQAVFVDTRDLGSYNVSHIPGALSIPIDEIESRLSELNKNDWIITYCT